jgi:subtilisin family serine protease
VILSSEGPPGGTKNGIAPDAGFVSVKAFDDDGRGNYLNVIRGLDWVVRNRQALNIRVMNLSFSAPPRSYYWDDPLNQAVMAAWKAGIVVVASAGNVGPQAMSVGVPGNVPYVITVGATTNSNTRGDVSDDALAEFSSAGPTVEAFVKPEVVAPGGYIVGVVERFSRVPSHHPQWLFGNYFYMSGTSQAAAIVSGAAALMLQDDPSLTPDDVKCRLMATSRPAIDASGRLAYSVFQQGAGLIDAYAAVSSDLSGCANRGLDIAADLAGTEHYRGRANRDDNGNYYIMADDGTVWSDAFMWNDSFMWSDAFMWNDSFMWSDAFMWNDSFMWSDGLTESMSINSWVEPE